MNHNLCKPQHFYMVHDWISGRLSCQANNKVHTVKNEVCIPYQMV